MALQRVVLGQRLIHKRQPRIDAIAHKLRQLLDRELGWIANIDRPGVGAIHQADETLPQIIHKAKAAGLAAAAIEGEGIAAQGLLEEGAELVIVDPKVPEAQIAKDLAQAPRREDASAQISDGGGAWQMASSAVAAAEGADAVLLLTEWAEFGDLDWEAIAAVMRKPAWLFDARATADASAARSAGLKVWRVGEG